MSVAGPDFDAIVVGAGLVGSAAALALANRGWRIAIIEQRPQGADVEREDVRALVLSLSSERLLSELGLWSQLSRVLWPIERVRIYDRGGISTLALDAADIDRETLAWSCKADVLLNVCIQAVTANDRIECCWATRFCGFRSTGDVVNVTVRAGDGEQTLTAGLLIAADGTESTVRQAANIPHDTFDYVQCAVVSQFTCDVEVGRNAFEYFTANGPLAFIPVGKHRVVNVQCVAPDVADELRALNDSDYLLQLDDKFGHRLGALSAPGARRHHALVASRATEIIGDGLIMVGNAANTVHPNGAQGLNLGLRDVFALDCVIAGARTRRNIARDYEALRRRDHCQTRTLCDGLAQSFVSPLSLVKGLRRGVITSLAYSFPARRQLAREITGLAALERIERQRAAA